jgi:diacylglycerol O-acyltransferase / trehalose O-mycolyltransferase
VTASTRRSRNARAEPKQASLRSVGALSIGMLVAACSGSPAGSPGGSPEGSVVGGSPTRSAEAPAGGDTHSNGPEISLPADDGARIVSVETVGSRAFDLTIDSPAVGTAKVRLLVPAAFESQPSTRWPVLYLLHGADDSFLSWTRSTDVVALTEPTDLLVVMPEGGQHGFYSDWWNGGKGGPPMWETFHLTEVRQLLERNWHASDRRVIAGLSMGGFGAMSYAARHPGMFVAAASFSGVLNPYGARWQIGSAIWGSWAAQADLWRAHDPTEQAAALAGTRLYVSYGNGEQGPLDAAPLPGDVEAELAPQNEAFVRRLGQLNIPVTVDAYGPGYHSWPYWQRALHDALPVLFAALGEQAPRRP